MCAVICLVRCEGDHEKQASLPEGCFSGAKKPRNYLKIALEVEKVFEKSGQGAV